MRKFTLLKNSWTHKKQTNKTREEVIPNQKTNWFFSEKKGIEKNIQHGNFWGKMVSREHTPYLWPKIKILSFLERILQK